MRIGRTSRGRRPGPVQPESPDGSRFREWVSEWEPHRLAFVLVFTLALGLASVMACAPRPAPSGRPPLLRTRFLLGTLVDVTVFAPDDDRAMDAAAAAFSEIARLEAIFSTYRDDSEISRLNGAGGEWLSLSPETLVVLSAATRISERSGGAFDVTVGPLVGLWRQAEERGSLPTEEEFRISRAAIGFRKVEIDEAGGRARLLGGVRVDPGGIAKGYIVDRACEALLRAGADGGIVNAGGDLRFAGRVDEATRRLRIREPRDPGATRVDLPLPGLTAVATSGNYERAYEIRGKRYGHILDPRTGRPAEGAESVTVTADSALLADAWATAVFVGGLEAATGLDLDAYDGEAGHASWPDGVHEIIIIRPEGLHRVREDGVMRESRDLETIPGSGNRGDE